MSTGKLIDLVLDAASLEERGQLSNLRYDEADAFGLDDRVLVEDDAPPSGVRRGQTSAVGSKKCTAG